MALGPSFQNGLRRPGHSVDFRASVFTSTPKLSVKTPQIPSNRDHRALIEVHWGVQVGC